MADIDIEAPGANEAALRDALFNLRTFNGALVRRTSDLTSQNITSALNVPFQEAVHDPFGLWSAGAPERLTITSDLDGAWVLLTGSVGVSLDTSDTYHEAYIRLNDSLDNFLVWGGSRRIEHGATTWQVDMVLGPWQVSTGDYALLPVITESDTSVTITSAGSGTRLGLIVLGMPNLS